LPKNKKKSFVVVTEVHILNVVADVWERNVERSWRWDDEVQETIAFYNITKKDDSEVKTLVGEFNAHYVIGIFEL